MAIHFCAANCPRRRLAHSEQSSTTAYPFVTRFITGGTIWSGVGLLSLQGILSAGAFGPCAPDGISRRGGRVGLFTQEPVPSYSNAVCRSRFYGPISASQRRKNFVQR